QLSTQACYCGIRTSVFEKFISGSKLKQCIKFFLDSRETWLTFRSRKCAVFRIEFAKRNFLTGLCRERVAKEMIDSRATRLCPRRVAFPEAPLQRPPLRLEKLLRRFSLGFGAMKDVISHKVHREQWLGLAVQRFENHLSVVIFIERDYHQFQVVKQCLKECLKAPSTRRLIVCFGRSFFVRVINAKPRIIVDLLHEEGERFNRKGCC